VLDVEDINGNGDLDVQESEDSNANQELDGGEDIIVVNGELDDTGTEDVNGNGILDTEDDNGNGIFDEGEDDRRVHPNRATASAILRSSGWKG